MGGGKSLGYFWISVGQLTEGTSGNLIVLMKGEDRNIFQLKQRLINFNVINPDFKPPQIISSKIIDVTDTSATFIITTNKPVTVYFTLGPPFQIPLTLEQLKKKKLPYDYFDNPFTIGEIVREELKQ